MCPLELCEGPHECCYCCVVSRAVRGMGEFKPCIGK